MKRVLEMFFIILVIGLVGQIVFNVLRNPRGTLAAGSTVRGILSLAYQGAGGQFASPSRSRTGGRGGRGGGGRGR